MNTATGEILLANAGFPDPLLVRDGAVQELVVEGPRLPAGLRSGTGYETARFELKAGDRLIMFSDGFPEAEDPLNGEPIGYPRAREIVAAASGDLAAWVDQIRDAVHGSGENPLADDLTILALELR